jgi:hypothetical protein
MNGLRRAETRRRDVETFEDVEHLCDVHAGGRRRRRPQDLPAAIIGADRLPLDGLVGGEVFARDKAAMRLHVIDQDVAERAVIQGALAVLRDIRQRLRIFGLHDALAGLERHALWQIDRRDRLVLQHLRRAIGDAFVQVRRRRVTARSVLDRGLHDIGKAHGAETLQRLAPRLQRTRHRNGFRAVEIFITHRVEHIMRRTRL